MDLEPQLISLCTAYGVQDLYVFGSRAQEIAARIKGEHIECSKPESDVDIGIQPAPDSTWDAATRVQLGMDLEDLFQVDCVDVVLLPEAEPYLALDIIKGELLYTRDPDRQAEHELYVIRRAGDLLPFKKERIRMILEEGGR